MQSFEIKEKYTIKMELWNIKDLASPPINTYRVGDNQAVDITHLYNVCQEAKVFFDNEKYMHAEYLVLSRIIYRMKQKFRSSKDFKASEKVNKALENYFRINLAVNLRNFMELIPRRYKRETYLPTKSLLDFILVRLQGMVKLLERVAETCRITAYLLEIRLHTGHFWKIAFILFSIVSRLYVLSKYITHNICNFYTKLLPFSSKLRDVSKSWIPKNYSFPSDLKEWLNLDWLNFDDEVQIIDGPKNIPEITKLLDLIDDDDDVVFCDEYVVIDHEERSSKRDGKIEKISKIKSDRKSKGIRDFRAEDIGEVMDLVKILDNENISVPKEISMYEDAEMDNRNENSISTDTNRRGNQSNAELILTKLTKNQKKREKLKMRKHILESNMSEERSTIFNSEQKVKKKGKLKEHENKEIDLDEVTKSFCKHKVKIGKLTVHKKIDSIFQGDVGSGIRNIKKRKTDDSANSSGPTKKSKMLNKCDIQSKTTTIEINKNNKLKKFQKKLARRK